MFSDVHVGSGPHAPPLVSGPQTTFPAYPTFTLRLHLRYVYVIIRRKVSPCLSPLPFHSPPLCVGGKGSKDLRLSQACLHGCPAKQATICYKPKQILSLLFLPLLLLQIASRYRACMPQANTPIATSMRAIGRILYTSHTGLARKR